MNLLDTTQPTRHPKPRAIDQARDIAGHPLPRHTPTMRLLAWAVLKAERDQTIHQTRLEAFQREGR